MDNINQNEPEEEEIPNIEQFQVGRSHSDDRDTSEGDAGYTEGEIEFADGEGTQLNEEIDNTVDNESSEEEE